MLANRRTIEGEAGVTPAESSGSQEDANALQDDEWGLVGDNLATVAFLELGDTVCATGEDENDGSGQTTEESHEAPIHGGHATGAPVSEHIVGEGGNEGGDDDDLEDQAGHGEVDTNIAVGLGGGYGAAGGLEDEADDIGGDEDPVEQLGLKA